MSTLSFTVVGVPAPQGSKRGFYNKGLGRVQMVESSKKVAPWRQDVAAAAQAAARGGWETPAGPVEVSVTFRLPRPRYHFRTGKRAHELKPNAPVYVPKKPDVDKLLRATLDALTSAGVIRDDAQVAVLYAAKLYTGDTLGAAISVSALTDSVPVAVRPGKNAAAGTDPTEEDQ